MRRLGTWMPATVAAGLLVAWVALGAQQPAARADRAPRARDGHPNLNGIWQAMNTAYWDIEAHSAAPSAVRELGAAGAVPAGLGIVEGGDLPYKPEALAKKKENQANRLKLDPEIKCYLPGVPRATYMPFPFQIVQGSSHVMLVHEFAGAVRTVYMENQTDPPADSWMGWSNGRWEGESLVVDTRGFNDQTWFDRAGNFHSDALHVVERWSFVDRNTISYAATLEDPKVYTRPWTLQVLLHRHREPGFQLIENYCYTLDYDEFYPVPVANHD